MRVVVTGGGTAGHVEPILSVVEELNRLEPKADIRFIRQVGDQATKEMLATTTEAKINKVQTIAAGKFRRYHGVSALAQAADIPMQLRNIRDGFFFTIGFLQSLAMFLFRRPDVVFVKGGYVGLPVGLAAVILRIPLVIHESDIIMGLTNRFLSRFAKSIGVGMPEMNYDLRTKADIRFVGIPVSNDFKQVDSKLIAEYRASFGISREETVIAITGGSQGAWRLNEIVSAIAPELVREAVVLHQTGHETFEETKRLAEELLTDNLKNRYKLMPFIPAAAMPAFLGAADVIICRAGGTTMAELALSAKAVILVPNPKLVKGHQLKNAEIYQKANAVLVIDETEATKDATILLETVNLLLGSAEKRSELAKNLHSFAKPEAAADIAKLILSQI
jgi:UDP-N-acetylglucosamine--N-acetylmuramyl-(pentapeptide) pyrophosphoryl-undecaprenol N-acetylglucosamine transferase